MTTTPAKPRKPRHGTVRRYKDGCRCDPCTAANTEARRRERERAAKKAGKAVPTTSKRVPTRRPAGPTTARRSTADDELVRVIEDALWDGQGSIAAAALAAEQLRELGYRRVEDGPIEAAARKALTTTGGDDALAVLRRETAFRAAAVMDNPKAIPFFKSAAEVLRITVGDLLAAAPPKDGEAGVLQQLMDSFGSRGGARRGAPVGDPEASE